MKATIAKTRPIPVSPKPKLGIKVVSMGDRWVGTLTVDEQPFNRMACNLKQDIGWMCREMLRWYDKLGGDSAWARAARARQTDAPVGKVWNVYDVEGVKRG